MESRGRRRGTVAVVVLAAAVAAVALWLPSSAWWNRRRGRAALEEAFARHRAAGLGSVPEDLLPGVPPVDPGLQRCWTALMGAGKEINPTVAIGRFEAERWAAAGRTGPVPEKAAAGRELSKWLREEADGILAAGRPVGGALGDWIAAGKPNLREPLDFPAQNLLGAKVLHNAFALEAILADDPRPSLESIDRLVAAFDHPGSLIDGMIAVSLDALRDQAYAFAAWDGRLPREMGDRWLAETPKEPLRVAQCLRGERLLRFGPFARGIAAGTLDLERASLIPGWEDGGFVNPKADVSGWDRHGIAACALALERYAALEAAVREGRAPAAFDPGAGPAADLARRCFVGDFRAAAHSVLLQRQNARAHRLLVRAIRMAEAGAPPESEEGFRTRLGKDAALLDPGPCDLRLLYERPAPGRVRVRIDPASPRSPLLGGLPVPELPERKPGQPIPAFDCSQRTSEARVPR
jgi:hypothetical protein